MPASKAPSGGGRRAKAPRAPDVDASGWRLLEDIRVAPEVDAGWLDFLAFAIPRARRSKAQLFQDIWAFQASGRKRGGYFVEFGACDGVLLSNTHMLERHFAWTGVVAEPNPVFHAGLARNRQCRIDPRCVWRASGERLAFDAVAEPEYSSLAGAARLDSHEANGRRIAHERIEVETVSLNDLLAEAGAPRTIDYLSLDTEGSELAILQAFDFDRYDVRAITVEHNDTPHRAEILALLTGAGFERRFAAHTRWDDWYVKV